MQAGCLKNKTSRMGSPGCLPEIDFRHLLTCMGFFLNLQVVQLQLGSLA